MNTDDIKRAANDYADSKLPGFHFSMDELRKMGLYDWSDIEDAFESGANWAKKELIENICKWLKENAGSYIRDTYYSDEHPYIDEKMIQDIMNEMKK